MMEATSGEKPAPKSAPKPAAKKDAKVSALTPVAGRPRASNGLVIDEFGLPVNGPARMMALEKLKAQGPRSNPKDWKKAEFSKAEIAKHVGELL